MRKFCAILFVAAVLCRPLSAHDAGNAPVAVSLQPQAWLVDSISQGRAAVTVALPRGGDPHTFEPTPRLVRDLSRSAIYISCGMGFEQTLTNALRGLSKDIRFFAADSGIAKRSGCGHHHGHGGHCGGRDGDPHIWMSPSLFAAMATNTATALREVLPASVVETGLRKTVAEIAAIGREVGEALADGKCSVLLSYHPSYAYFARRYGLRTMEIEHEGKAPSARRLAEIVRTAKSAGVRNVLADAARPRRAAETAAAELGGRAIVIDTLQRDWPAMMKMLAGALCED